MTYGRISLAALALALAGTGAMAETFRLIVTDLEAPLVPNSIMDMAVSRGYFAEEGVEVELVRVQQTPSALAALQAGEGEMANISVDAILQLVLNGADDLRAVVSPNKSLPFLIAGREDIATAADMGGHSFGVGRVGSVDYSLSMNVLAQAGVAEDSLQIVPLGQPDVRAQALAAGQIDATTVSIGVWSSLPDTTGLHVIVDTDAYYAAAPVVNKVNIVLAETLETRGEEVDAVVRALIRASRDVAADPSLWVAFMQEARPDVDVATLEMLAETFAQSWSVNGGLSRSELEFTTEWLYRGEDFAGARPVALDEWVDFGPADRALEALGTAEGMDEPAR